MRVENLNIDILRQLEHRAKESTLAKFHAFEDWLAGAKFPTVKQLSHLANVLNVPFGYFFLKSLPEKEMAVPHYRTKDQGFSLLLPVQIKV